MSIRARLQALREQSGATHLSAPTPATFQRDTVKNDSLDLDGPNSVAAQPIVARVAALKKTTVDESDDLEESCSPALADANKSGAESVAGMSAHGSERAGHELQPGAGLCIDAPPGYVGRSSDEVYGSCPPELDRFRRVGNATGNTTGHAAGVRAVDREAALAKTIGAVLVADGVLCCQAQYRLPHQFGAGHIAKDCIQQAVSLLNLDIAPIRRIVALDTETTGLAGGTGTVPFLTGVLICDEQQATLQQWLLTRFDGEQQLLEMLIHQLEPGDLLVTYNGKSYDMPLLETRARLNRLKPDFEQLPHLDLLSFVRRAFSGRWSDCRLQTAERHLLLRVRQDDIPGSEIPAVWFDWMRGGGHGAIERVVEHNRLDLVGLVALIERLSCVFATPEQFGAKIIPTLSHMGAAESELSARLQAHDDQLDARERIELARLARRQGRWELAVAQWRRLAEQGELVGFEQLAKFSEHRRKDYPAALRLTRELMARDGARPEHRKRELRLLRRIETAVASWNVA